MTLSGGIAARRQRFDFAESTSSDGGGGEYNPFGRPGAGAPIRTDSGQMVTSLRADPDTRFQTQLRREVEHSMVRLMRDYYIFITMYATAAAFISTLALQNW